MPGTNSCDCDQETKVYLTSRREEAQSQVVHKCIAAINAFTILTIVSSFTICDKQQQKLKVTADPGRLTGTDFILQIAYCWV